MYTLTHLLTDVLDTGIVDYLTPDNTFVTDVHQLEPLAIPSGRRLLAASLLRPQVHPSQPCVSPVALQEVVLHTKKSLYTLPAQQ